MLVNCDLQKPTRLNDNIEVVVEEVSPKESDLYDMFHVAENDK